MPPPQLRSELQAAPRWRHGARWWVVRDPWRETYHRLHDQDFRDLYTGVASPELLREAIGSQLVLDAQPRSSAAIGKRLTDWLMIRLPGIAMDGMAQRLVPGTQWLFSGPAVVFWLCLIAAAWLTILTQPERVQAALPRLQSFLQTSNVVTILMLTVGSKVLHELAHAVVCRRLGARVGEVGVLFLCGMPCMYCDVTAAWGLSRRRHRAAVMAAGIYVESILASLAAAAWWLTQPGWFNTVCLDVMIVCGVSTVLFNGNPLMRYDGYFILCDLLDTPNLMARAQIAWNHVVRTVLGDPQARLRDVPLSSYHLASFAYRLFATVMIGWWMVRLFSALHLYYFGFVALGITVMINLLPWLRGLVSWWRGSGDWQGIPRLHRYLALGAILIALAGWMLMEGPVRVEGHGTVQVLDASGVFIPPTGGRVMRISAALGEIVQAGDELLRLENPELEQRYLEVQTRCAQLSAKLDGLTRRALQQPALLEQRDTVAAALQAAEIQRQWVEKQRDALVVRAPQAGMVLPAEETPFSPSSSSLGTWCDADQPWCRIGNPEQLGVRLQLPRDLRRHLGIGNPARLVSSLHTHAYRAEVVAVVEPTLQDNRIASPTAESPSSDPAEVTVWCALSKASSLPIGTEMRGWVEGTIEPRWERLLRATYRTLAP